MEKYIPTGKFVLPGCVMHLKLSKVNQFFWPQNINDLQYKGEIRNITMGN